MCYQPPLQNNVPLFQDSPMGRAIETGRELVRSRHDPSLLDRYDNLKLTTSIRLSKRTTLDDAIAKIIQLKSENE